MQHLRLLNNVRVEVRCAETLPAVLVDREKFHQVIRHLALNALAAMKDCDRRILTFTGETDQSEQMVKLSVQDSGRGIAPEHLQEIFKPSYSSGQNGSSGLGLTMVKEIVENDFDGRISVRSELGRGSKFSIWLCPEAVQPAHDGEGELVVPEFLLENAQALDAGVLSEL